MIQAANVGMYRTNLICNFSAISINKNTNILKINKWYVYRLLIGVGIVGKEGRQASLAADFSVTQFSHLTKLMCKFFEFLILPVYIFDFCWYTTVH